MFPVWVALGDSYSSGEGAGAYEIDRNGDSDFFDPGEDTDFRFCEEEGQFGCQSWDQNLCHRSRRAYPHLATYSSLRATSFHACSGATVTNLLSSTGGGNGRRHDGSPYSPTDDRPQLDHGDATSADMVTLTIGGNDTGFAEILYACYFATDCRNEQVGSTFTQEERIRNWIRSGVRARVNSVLGEVCDSNPHATIYLLGYPKLFPADGPAAGCTNDYFNGEDELFSWPANEQAWLNRVADQLNAVLGEEAEKRGAYFVDVDALGFFRGHEICGTRGTFFTIPQDFLELWSDVTQVTLFHPSAVGQLLGYRRALISYLTTYPPRGPTAPECIGGSTTAEVADAGIAALTASTPAVETLGSIAIDSASPCGGHPAGEPVTLSGSGFASGMPITLQLRTSAGTVGLGATTADSTGNFSVTVILPLAPSALALLEATGTGTNGQFRLSRATISIGPTPGTDTDADGIADDCDRCPQDPDTAQTDSDGDGYGDACDSCPADADNDGDDDGLCAAVDPCPFDATNDADGDGLCGGEQDNCPGDYNPNQEDSDGDLLGDACDEQPLLPNAAIVFRDGFESADLCRWDGAGPGNGCPP